MEQAIGKVISLNKSFASVKLDRKSMCGESCASCGGMCGINNTIIRAVNSIGAKEGDIVKVEIPTSKGISAMFITYGIPLIYMIAVAFLMAIFLTEKQGIFLIAAGLCLWALVLFLFEKNGKLKASFKTEIISIIKENSL